MTELKTRAEIEQAVSLLENVLLSLPDDDPPKLQELFYCQLLVLRWCSGEENSEFSKLLAGLEIAPQCNISASG